MGIANFMAAVLAAAACSPAAGAALDATEYRYHCRVTGSEETSEGAAHAARGDPDARSYLIDVRDVAARATAQIWGVKYSTGWMRGSAGGGRSAGRYSGTAGGRRILRPLELAVELRPMPDGTATGTVTAYQADGGVTVTDGVECAPADDAPATGKQMANRERRKPAIYGR